MTYFTHCNTQHTLCLLICHACCCTDHLKSCAAAAAAAAVHIACHKLHHHPNIHLQKIIIVTLSNWVWCSLAGSDKFSDTCAASMCSTSDVWLKARWWALDISQRSLLTCTCWHCSTVTVKYHLIWRAKQVWRSAKGELRLQCWHCSFSSFTCYLLAQCWRYWRNAALFLNQSRFCQGLVSLFWTLRSIISIMEHPLGTVLVI